MNEITEYMKREAIFEEQPDGVGKRFWLINKGERIAYVWHKYSLGGWYISLHKIRKIEGPIESLQQFKEIIIKHTA